MKVIGLTGGVGMGKTTVAAQALRLGVAVSDTDDLARQVVAPGSAALQEIAHVFGDGLIDSAGGLKRSELAHLVFSDTAARQKLEAIVHPRIRNLWRVQLAEWRGQGFALAMVVIPLLFETSAESEMDATICVACSAATQLSRLRPRGWDEEHIRARLAAQWPIEMKMAKATHVIWTEGSLEVAAAQLDRIVRP
jgi:dephospho-CoA kinase